VTVLKPVDLDLLAFAYHVVNAQWHRQAATAGAAAASAAA
jgi:hypothetical protein